MIGTSKILTVAWRDFRLTVMRPAFLIAVVGIPVLIAVIMGVFILMMFRHKEPPLEGTLMVAAPAADVIEAARAEFDEAAIDRDRREAAQATVERMKANPTGAMTAGGPGAMPLGRGDVRIRVEPVEDRGPAELERLKSDVREGRVLAVAVVPEAVIAPPDPGVKRDEQPKLELFVAEDLDADHTSLIERQLGKAVVRVRAARRGLDPKDTLALVSPPASDTRRVLASGEEAEEGRTKRQIRQMIPMVFFLLLWVATFTAGQHLMMSTIEEKSNRVMEVLLSAVSPMQLMTGKIIGQGGVGLIIMAIYTGLGLGGLVAYALLDMIEPLDLAYLVLFFFMAYFMIASIMSAVGSAVSDIREANALFTPVMLVLALLWGLWLPISADPNGAVGTVFSFVPPAIPFAMVLRLAADEPVPLWQIPATIAWGSLCVVAMVWMAAKVFRVGVLMYGKPPSVFELVRWVRYR